MTAKRCTVCHLSKSPSMFTPSKRSRDGRAARCKACANIAHGAWKAKQRAIRRATAPPQRIVGNADPLDLVLTPKDLERYWARVEETPTCWLWKGHVRNGYGTFSHGGRERAAHRLALRIAGYALDPQLVVDHICKVRLCVRPDHLRQVTQRFNSTVNSVGLVAENSRKQFCGACKTPFSAENTFYYYTGRTMMRVCLHCYRASRPGSKRQPNTEADAVQSYRIRHPASA